jgi:hypothetical protein
MPGKALTVTALLCLSICALAQNKRLWVIRSSGEAVEYNPATFSEKQTVKIPTGAAASLSAFSVNSQGQMLFVPPAALPLMETDLAAERKVWFWDGHQASTLTRDVSRTTSTAGSNLVIAESAPTPFLSSDGKSLFWFSNQARRLQRDGVDLSTKNTWLSWQTDLAGPIVRKSPPHLFPSAPAPRVDARKPAPMARSGCRRAEWKGFFSSPNLSPVRPNLSINPLPSSKKTQASGLRRP